MKWIDVNKELPKVESYYEVKFENGDTDEKPFRIRPHRNIRGFMTMQKVTHWRPLQNKKGGYLYVDKSK